MPELRTRPASTTVEVVRPMNDHGAMTVELVDRNETRHVVECASQSVREALRRLPVGSSIPLELERLGPRANAWRAVDIHRR